MPRKRQPQVIWNITRERVWERDSGICTHCYIPTALDVCHCDHIKSGKTATNDMFNLRTLCPRCHVLRADFRHRGMIARALAIGLIPPNWRELVWDDP